MRNRTDNEAFQGLKVPDPPGSGKDAAEGKVSKSGKDGDSGNVRFYDGEQQKDILEDL